MLYALSLYAAIGVAFAGVCIVATSGAPRLERTFIASLWLALWLPFVVMTCCEGFVARYTDDHPRGF